MNLTLDFVKKVAKGAITFSKKNLPSIMIGGSIIGFWTAAIIVARKAPDAKKEIEYEDNKRKEDGKEPLNWKDKTVIYGKHCWSAGAIGLASTGLAIGAHKIDLSRLAEMYVLTQFYKDDGEKLKKAILKKPDGEKELASLRNDIINEEYPEEEMRKMKEWLPDVPGKGSTLFIDEVTNKRWNGNIVDVMNGIQSFNELMKGYYSKEWKRKMPFYAADGSPHHADDLDIYARERLDVFLEYIGETDEVIDDSGLGDLLEFRCYSDESDLLRPKEILKYKQYLDPDSGVPKVCFIDYREYLAPTGELLERYPS